MTSEIKVDTISEQTSANGVTIDGLTIKDGNIIGDVALAGTTPTFTIGDAGAEDAALIFDGNAQDFYIALDDSADDLIIGLGAAVGTTPMLSFTEAKAAAFTGAVSMATTLGVTGAVTSAAAIVAGGGNAPTLGFQLPDTSGNAQPRITNDANNDTIIRPGASGRAVMIANYANNLNLVNVTASGAIFNEGSGDLDFRVESNGNTHMLFVDGGNDHVNIGGSSDAGGLLNVFGKAVFKASDNSDNIELLTTDADANVGPNLRLYRNSSSPAVNDLTGSISFEGKDDGGNDFVTASMRSQMTGVTNGSEEGKFWIETMVAGTARQRMSIAGAETIFNEDSVDVDFRVESNDEANFFVIDGGNNVAGIGTTGSTIRFYIQNASNSNTSLAVQNTASDNAGVMQGNDAVRAANSAYGFFRGNSSNGADVEINLRGDGNAFCDGSFQDGGADYAEYFEWNDGNSSDEDRVGYSVILNNNKIVKATDSDDASKIIGVISGNPAVVGDSAWNKWQEKHVKDDWNRYTFEDYTQTEWKDEEGKIVTYQTDLIPADVTVPDNAVVTSKDQNNDNLQRRVVNSNWDSTITYVPRSDRKEWDTVGLMGKLRLRKGQPTGTNWLKMRDISDTVEEWLVR